MPRFPQTGEIGVDNSVHRNSRLAGDQTCPLNLIPRRFLWESRGCNTRVWYDNCWRRLSQGGWLSETAWSLIAIAFILKRGVRGGGGEGGTSYTFCRLTELPSLEMYKSRSASCSVRLTTAVFYKGKVINSNNELVIVLNKRFWLSPLKVHSALLKKKTKTKNWIYAE